MSQGPSRLSFLTLLGVVAVLAVACAGSSSTADASLDLPDLVLPDAARDVTPDLVLPDLWGDLDAVGKPDVPPTCEPGEGEFGCPCSGLEDCATGWCLPHLGELRCSKMCNTDEPCPAGYACAYHQDGGDIFYLCESKAPALCLPCAGDDDCRAFSAGSDVCLRYGDAAGSFCGARCTTDAECPEGTACADAITTDGAPTRQCMAVA